MLIGVLLLPWSVMRADTRMYHCEVGVQGGCGYYVGDATRHIFTNPLDVYGGQFRYKFDKRWAIQAKAQRQRIMFRDDAKLLYYNPLWHVDVVAEFNFFRFGERGYDMRVKPVTPYIYIGVGTSIYNKAASLSDHTVATMYPTMGKANVGVYIPFGIGMKWKFADRWQLHVAWQHQVYLVDNLEGLESLDGARNPMIDGSAAGMNGTNILNNDLTSTLTLGIVFEFAKGKKVCNHCEY